MLNIFWVSAMLALYIFRIFYLPIILPNNCRVLFYNASNRFFIAPSEGFQHQIYRLCAPVNFVVLKRKNKTQGAGKSSTLSQITIVLFCKENGLTSILFLLYKQYKTFFECRKGSPNTLSIYCSIMNCRIGYLSGFGWRRPCFLTFLFHLIQYDSWGKLINVMELVNPHHCQFSSGRPEARLHRLPHRLT